MAVSIRLCTDEGFVPVGFFNALTERPQANDALKFVLNQSASRGIVGIFDIPPTAPLKWLIEQLINNGFSVAYRDHKAPQGAPCTPRERQMIEIVRELQAHPQCDILFESRLDCPSCSSMIASGEGRDYVCIITDNDADGLLTALKAVHPVLPYPQFDRDGVHLDGHPKDKVRAASWLAGLLVKWLEIMLVPYSQDPERHDRQRARLFARWARAALGDKKALARLRVVDELWPTAVATSQRLAGAALPLVGGKILYVDTIDQSFDLGTLLAELESRPGVVATAIRSYFGPVAKGCREEVTLSVVSGAGVHVQRLIPAGLDLSGADGGALCSTNFHAFFPVHIWLEVILPNLPNLLARESQKSA
jgi:hypothetical protein